MLMLGFVYRVDKVWYNWLLGKCLGNKMNKYSLKVI